MLRKTHLKLMWEAWPFAAILLAGLLVFIADYREFSSPESRVAVLLIVSLAKSVWFVWFVIRRIRLSTSHEFFFHEFMVFICANILLFVLSYAIDFFCLFQINPHAFSGLP